MKKLLPLAAACFLAAAPVAAQEGEDDDPAAFLDMMSAIFQAEPLSPEAEARLPAAAAVVERLLPPGSYGRMMDGAIGGALDGLTNLFDSPRASTVARLTGLSPGELAWLDEETLGAALDLLDPVHEQRSQLLLDRTRTEAAAMMSAMEPPYREGLTRAYAVHFTAEQLADLMAFFDTPTGAYYASISTTIQADPQVMAASAQMTGAMLEGMSSMMQRIEEAEATLPEARFFDMLEPAERSLLAELLGVSEDELAEASLYARAAAEEAEEDDAFWFGEDALLDETY